MKSRLITSALPYVNNVPHLGNLIQVLSADVFARACRLKAYKTLYVCGTDEYGTATETKAQEEGVSPADLCSRFYKIHKEIYEWFGIAFDKFGRTSTTRQTEIVQGLFKALDEGGYIKEETIEQLYCESCSRFLADRYVRGTCPHCGYADARGDQCEHCGKLLDPTDLQEPRCSVCAQQPYLRSTRHLYIDLPAIRPKLEAWIQQASVDGFWSNNAVQMTQAWIRDGLKPRAITRDLKWGIPVPKPGFEDKVFYVWFDAPIGYISIAATLADENGMDWRQWWQNPDNVELFQFIGKDNIPFHTVIFPSTLLASGGKWTMLHHMSSSEYLNYEAGKFSKSKGIGVFGTDVMETGIPADVWRFYIFYNRPEKSDFTFTWNDFLEKVNGELIGNLGNLVNRTLAFIVRFYDGKIPVGEPDSAFWSTVRNLESEIAEKLERAELRDAFRLAFQISDLANKRFQDTAPWKARTEDPAKAASLLCDLCYVLRNLAIIMHPYMPQAMDKLASFFGFKVASGLNQDGLRWDQLGIMQGLTNVTAPDVLFAKLDPKHIEELRERYSGSQKERSLRDQAKQSATDKTVVTPVPAEKPALPLADLSPEQRFSSLIDLRVAKITAIEQHPKADKLYIETLDDGSDSERVIVSGLVPFYQPEELLGKHIVIVNNLKPAKLRGTVSNGMLLAASFESDGGQEVCEVLDAGDLAPGTRILLAGQEPDSAPLPQIDVDTFFSVPIIAQNGRVRVGDRELMCGNNSFLLKKVQNGMVG